MFFDQIYHWSILPGPVVGRILDSCSFAGLEFAWLHYLAHFEGKRPGDDSQQFDRKTSVHRCGIGPASGGIHPQNLPIVLLPPTSRCQKKWSLTSKMVSQLPNTHQPVLFRAAISFNKTRRPVEKKNILVHDWPPHPVHTCHSLYLHICLLSIIDDCLLSWREN